MEDPGSANPETVATAAAMKRPMKARMVDCVVWGRRSKKTLDGRQELEVAVGNG